jgi:hypothetical protein
VVTPRPSVDRRERNSSRPAVVVPDRFSARMTSHPAARRFTRKRQWAIAASPSSIGRKPFVHCASLLCPRRVRRQAKARITGTDARKYLLDMLGVFAEFETNLAS